MKDGNSKTAENFLRKLLFFRSPDELEKHRRYFKFVPEDQSTDNYFIGVRMGQVFELAKEFIDMPPDEIEKLLESPIHEARAGAVSIMGKKASAKKTSDDQLKGLYDLYLRRHDRVNNWDLVDLAAHQVVGRYLADKPRDILYKLARSKNEWERRSAIVATAHFIRQGDVDDALNIAELLLGDDHPLVHKAAGWMLRYTGDKELDKLLDFLNKHAAAMPRAMLRASIEKLSPDKRDYYLKLKKAA